MPDPKRVVRVSTGTLYREVQGEAVLLQLDSGEYFGLDEVATRVWQLIVEKKGELAAVEAAMLEEFDVDRTVLSGDISRMQGPFSTVLQHDAVLRPSAMGGPVVDDAGRCIGMNIARADRTSTYAIPARFVRQVYAQLKG